MQNAANNNSNFTVENLVAKYRNYVAENCPKIAECSEWQDKDGKGHYEEYATPISPDGDAEEQLIITLYNAVAGNDADKSVQDALSKYAEKFYVDALTEDELSFLCANLKEAVSISLSHLREHKYYLGLDAIPPQVIDIIKENTTIRNGSTVFVADSCIGDVATLFAGCIVKGYTFYEETYHSELWALAQIRLYAQKISSMILKSREGCAEKSYITDVDFIVWGSARFSAYEDIVAVYNAVKPGTKMILFMDKNYAASEDSPTYGIRKKLVDDQAIKSIISFEYTDDEYNVQEEKIVLIIEKSAQETVRIKNGQNGEILDIPTELLDHELLWPSFYSTTRPENGIPLSEIVAFVDLTDREVIKDGGDWVLPEEVKGMPVAVPAKMAREYKDANLMMQDLDLAGNKLFDNQWKFWIRALKDPCVLLYGNKEKTVVGYIRELPKTGIATLDTIVCLVPKDGIDVRYVAALLLTPEVKGQLESICQGFINDLTFPLVMNKVIVPNHSDKERLEFMSEANYEALNSLRRELEVTYQEKYDAMKSDYINEVRMRKHDMRPYLRQLASSERLMLHYVDESKEIEELKKHMRSQLGYAHEALSSLSNIVDHLSNEEKFGKPEVLNLDKLLEEIEVNHDDKEGFTIEYDCDRESFNKSGIVMPDLIQQWEEVNKKGGDMKQFIQSLAKEILPLFVEIAPIDFQRLVDNIIDNARNHGFTDNRRTDYYLGIDLSYHSERGMYQIDFTNNGNPLPEGMTKSRFGIRGEKAGLTAGTGSGGYIVKSIVNHYGGDYDIFCKDGITTVRILLPIATI